MLSGAEIARGTEGALKFLWQDQAAPHHFDNSIEACLRSFWVMALTAPLYAIYLVVYYAGFQTPADDVEIVLVEVLQYVVDWLLYPVIFYEIARHRGWLARYPRYIAALNWISLPATAMLVVAKLFTLVVPSAGPIVDFGLQGLVFYWFLIVTRMTMAVGWPASASLLIVNWVPEFFLSLIVARYLELVPLPGT